jgi:CMP-N-acetylneuraminic acid synthetase
MFIGVIPARGGSKSIPRKNIRMIAGKPLIAWTIEAAKRSKLLDRFIVSTEDAEISKIAEKFGAAVLKRPVKFSSDSSTTLSVLQHVVKEIPCDAVVLLQPTSPVRDRNLIDSCIKRYIRKKADTLATGFICKFKEYGTYSARRQELDGFFYDDGNVYVIDSGLIKKGKMMGKKVERVEISKEQNIEIDEAFDFWMVEQILAKRRVKP